MNYFRIFFELFSDFKRYSSVSFSSPLCCFFFLLSSSRSFRFHNTRLPKQNQWLRTLRHRTLCVKVRQESSSQVLPIVMKLQVQIDCQVLAIILPLFSLLELTFQLGIEISLNVLRLTWTHE